MTVKPQNIKYVPLFEEHKAINERFAALPEGIKRDLATVISLDEEAIVCGSLGMYLAGMQTEMPKGVDVIVRDASKMKLVECEQENLDFPPNAHGAQENPNLDYPPQPQAQEGQPAQGEVVVITVTPQGEVSSIAADERPEGEYDEEGNFHFEGFKWMNGKPEGAAGTVNVFESCNKIKTMPIALGNITVLVEDPGVMSEYRKKFAKVKGKITKAKYEKSPGYDKTKKQGHVTKENELQDTPEK